MTSNPTTMPPAPKLGRIAIAGRFHSIPTVSIPGRRFAAQRQTADTEDHQQTKSYDFLYEHLSPFRDGKKVLVPRGPKLISTTDTAVQVV
jgi:hypothetical protein